ncbi:hypothetical protein GCM10009122_09000 [Fulvivirga kasyanovii]
MVSGYLIASKYLNYVTPMYESTTKLRLADLNEGISNSNLFKDFDVFASTNKIAAEIEVLKSQVLLEKTVSKLDFSIETYRVGKIRSVELYHQAPFLVHVSDLPESCLDKSFDLNITDKKHYTLTTPDRQLVRGTMGDTLKTTAGSFYIRLNDQLLRENPHLKIIDHYQFQVLSKQKLLGQIMKNLDVMALDKDLAVIRISFKSPSPDKASTMANKLAEVYIQDYIDTKHKLANITVNFLEDQIELVNEKLTKAENQIQDFRDNKGITNIRQETETDMRKISQLKIQQTNLKMSLEAIQELEAYVKEGKDHFLDLAPNFEAFTDLLSTEIVKKIKDLQAEKRDLLLTYTPEDDRVKVIDSKIKDLTSYLIESITNTRKNLEVKYNKLSTEITASEQVFIGVPEKEKNLTIMKREFNIYQQTYNFLNEKKIEAEIAQAARIAFHRVITPAEISKQPVSPNGAIIKIVSAILGMFATVLFIFAVHKLKAKVNDKSAIETSSLIPIAALTPKLKDRNTAEEHFQKVAAQLEIKGLISKKDLICLSSFRPKEGAVFNSLNLARAISYQERKVLLIDVADDLKLATLPAGEIQQLSDHLYITGLNNDDYKRFSKDKLKTAIANLNQPFDLTLILNAQLGTQMSLLMMDLSTTNLIVLDSRLTPEKRIIEADLMKQEYDLPNVHFLLNRNGYTPSIFSEVALCLLRTVNFIKGKINKIKQS